MKLFNIFPMRERFVTIQQFLDIDRRPHIYAMTNKRVIEIDYNKHSIHTTIMTIRQAKKVKEAITTEKKLEL